MRVRTAAGLHGAHLHRPGEVTDVEDANAAEALGADVVVDTLEPAVYAAARFFHGHDEEFAYDRNVALPARAHDGTHQFEHAVVLQPVDIEAVVASGDEDVAGKRHVRVREAEQRVAFVFFLGLLLGLFTVLAGRFFGFRFLGLVGLRLQPGRRQLGGVARIEEARGLGEGSHEFQVPDRLAGVVESGREPGARVVRQADKQHVHAFDLGALAVGDLVYELEQHRVVRGTGLLEQLLDHRDRALVVRDHQLEEQAVEVGGV